MAFKTDSFDSPPDIPLYEISVMFPATTPKDTVTRAACIFDGVVISVTEFTDERKIMLITDHTPDLDAVADSLAVALNLHDLEIRAKVLPDRDWLAYVCETFPPLVLGSFFVYGSHYTGPLPEDKIYCKSTPPMPLDPVNTPPRRFAFRP